MNRIIAATLLVALAGGCASTPVTKTPVAISGSRADGTVRMAYDVAATESVTVDWAGADANALKRCQAWGYTKVEAFAGTTTECNEMGRGLLINGALPGSCAKQMVSKEYQCLD